MKKSDVETRYDRGRYTPTINVKWSPWVDTLIRKFEGTTATSDHICAVCGQAKFFHNGGDGHADTLAASGQLITDHRFKKGGTYTVHEFGNDTEFWQWVHENADNDYTYEWADVAYECAREVGWEDAIELANEVFPQSVKVWSEGRSGGWLVVDGLPPVDEWDAIQLGYWAKFCRGVQDILDNLDYSFIWHLCVNVWEPHNEEAKAIAQRMVMS